MERLFDFALHCAGLEFLQELGVVWVWINRCGDTISSRCVLIRI